MYCARLSWLLASVTRTELSMLNPELRHDRRFRAKSSDRSFFCTRSQITRLRKTSVIACKPENGMETNAPSSSNPPSGKTILIVDDEEGIRHGLENLFRRRGNTVRACGSYQEAIEAATRVSIDAAVLDIRFKNSNTQGQQFAMGTENVTLYAKWNVNPTYTVTYDGSAGGSVPVDATNYEQGQLVTVLGNTGSLVIAGHSFVGWNTQADGNGTTYTQGQTFAMGTADVTLYAKWTAYTLRDTGPAGGLICYDKGAYSNGWRYIEAAPSDLTSRVWGTYPYTVPGAAGTAIGTGIQNTLDIINGDPLADKAADECDNYSIENGGVVYDDWFLPSKDELNLMYVNLHQHGVGGFTTSNTYWSSSEYEDSAYNVWVQNFSTGSQGSVPKKYVKPIRAVRVF